MRVDPFVGIPIFNRAGDVVAWTKVDLADAEQARYPWCLSHGYVKRIITGRQTTYLHRAVMGDTGGLQVDHINRDRLDNRRSNLRLVTTAQNRQNTVARGGHSQYRGVTFDIERGKWLAQARLDGRNRFLGRFDTEDEAAHAAEAWRREHMPFSNEDVA